MTIANPELFVPKIEGDLEGRIKKIRDQFKNQIYIAIIGAKEPLTGYTYKMGQYAGEAVREWIGLKSGGYGYICTGGSEGVGVDAYMGVLSWCMRKDVLTSITATEVDRARFPEKFFTLVADGAETHDHYHKVKHMKTRNDTQTKEMHAGTSGQERRWYLAKIADASIVANGQEGTLEEGLAALYWGNSIIVLKDSGGAAKIFADLKMSPQEYSKQESIVRAAGFKWDVNYEYLFRSGKINGAKIHLVSGKKRGEIRKGLRWRLNKIFPERNGT